MNKRIKILGLVGSSRKMGNTEILVKAALKSAAENGAEVELIRLTDFNILPCRGCVSCIRLNTDCRINDDMTIILDKFKECDGLVMGVPIYTYHLPAIYKLIHDRVYMIHKDYRKFIGKKAAIIAVGAMEIENNLVIPMSYLFLRSFLFHPVSCVKITKAMGPGSVLLNKKAMEKAKIAGKKVHNAIQSNLKDNNSIGCSFCNNNFVEIIKNKIRCPFCGRNGELKNNGIVWENGKVINYLSPEFIIDFFGINKWTSTTRAAYKKEILEISERKKEYKDKNLKIRWIQKEDKKEYEEKSVV
ncbi:MAG: flavodoxin family protein [Spirochaetales bacterium]|nr:flavodoxin family protein [Spirochaetales bacterium]